MTIDLRSDTVTRPTEEMRRAMATARVGDDVFGDDPTVRALEELAAHKTGKEAALFLPSGTMGNQVALLSHTNRGDEAIVDADCHIFMYEVAGPAVLAGIQLRTLRGSRGYLEPEAIAGAVRLPDLHAPVSRLLCLENTHNRAGGTVVSQAGMEAMTSTAHTHGLAVHLDGARIFNAAVALGVSVPDLVRDCDSVMFCLSKGLAAPVGSMLAGTTEFITRARRYRKMLGGGMRQAGILASAGIIALEQMAARLQEDHENARLLADGLAAMPGLIIERDTVQTNIVVFNLNLPGLDTGTFLSGLARAGVLAVPFGAGRIRMVTHKDVTRADIGTALQAVAAVLEDHTKKIQ